MPDDRVEEGLVHELYRDEVDPVCGRTWGEHVYAKVCGSSRAEFVYCPRPAPLEAPGE